MKAEGYDVDDSPLGVLSAGGQATIRVAKRCSDGACVVIKASLEASPSSRLDVVKEYHALSRLDHPHVIKVLDMQDDGTRAQLVVPLCSGGELFDEVVSQVEARTGSTPEQADHCGALSFDTVRLWTRELASALHHSHSRGVFHRDVKAENILLDGEGHVVLVDFGLALLAPDGARALAPTDLLAKTQCGSIMYAAPEVLGLATDDGRTYDPAKADTFSLGVVVYSMLTGLLPFKCAHAGICTNYSSFLQHGISALAPHLPAACLDLLGDMLHPDPDKRCTVADVLANPWVGDGSYALKQTMSLESMSPPGPGGDGKTGRSSAAERSASAHGRSKPSVTLDADGQPTKRRRTSSHESPTLNCHDISFKSLPELDSPRRAPALIIPTRFRGPCDTLDSALAM